MTLTKLLLLLENLIKLKVAAISRTAGSLLWLDFEPSDTGEKGEWGIRVYAPWIVQDNSGLLLTSNDPHTIMDTEIQNFVGLQITEIEIFEPSYDVRFIFENDIQLRIFPARSDLREGHNIRTLDAWTLDKYPDFIISINSKKDIQYSTISNDYSS